MKSCEAVQEYYRHPAVRSRIREYCGSRRVAPLTCVSLVAFRPNEGFPTWESAEIHPPEDLARLLNEGVDIARSMWDTEGLLFYLDLDYLNADHPAEPFLHPADVFFKLEPVYRAARHVLHGFGLAPLELTTGRGYHFVGRIPWTHPIIDRLAALAPEVPAWHETLDSRCPTWLTERLDVRQARAASGLGLLTEYVAHLILRRASPRATIPVVLNGAEVGAGLTGRACVSIDLSSAGDPLDARSIRVAFGAYQLHQLRPDIFGSDVAEQVPPMAAVPRGRRSLYDLLTDGRSLASAARGAERHETTMPDVAEGIAAILVDYLPSRLATFHHQFYAVTPQPPEKWPETYDRLELASLVPCVAAPLLRPNDLLLQPARIQHLTRGLLAIGWHPRHIAGLVHSVYAREHGWGMRWTRLDARTRAEFDVRVFAGLVATGLDQAVDLNCVSAKEKGICVHDPACRHDLRFDRMLLLHSASGVEGSARS